MRKGNSKIGRCLEFFALQKIGMTIKVLSYSGKFSSSSYSGLSRVSKLFKWILGTSPRMTPTLSSYSCNFSFLSYSCLTRVSMAPRNTSEDECYKKYEYEDVCSECMFENDFTLKSLFQAGSFISLSLRANFPLLSSLRADRRGQAIYELEKRGLICRCLDVFLRKRGMTIMLWILVSSLTMTNIAHAECTPAPDCVELGYIETSCNGGFVHCPFDINKLFCLPCDSSYKYDCSGTGEIGSGTICTGNNGLEYCIGFGEI